MPSIIFHLTEAKLITQHLREASADYPFTHIHGWQNDFTIGSILPDAIPRPLKYKTHFWHPSDFSHVVIAPDLNLWQKTIYCHFYHTKKLRLHTPRNRSFFCYL